ncbi:helix-turn-helix domain-containing protein, partial [Kocuria sp. UCD-OTCP]|uniref:helix-turn-helix domain-containing protein n=1 Tax=Kocuria sp. UCD-OTCP TaxID=1292021 RepID=UPI001237224E
MITVEDWALIRRLHAEGVPKSQIASRLGISRNTVAKAVTASRPPRYERSTGPNAFRDVEPAVRALLAEHPMMPATVLAERVGWSGSVTWFRDNLRAIRSEYAPVDPADRLSYRPGDQVQCDLWFPPARIPLGGAQCRCRLNTDPRAPGGFNSSSQHRRCFSMTSWPRTRWPASPI